MNRAYLKVACEEIDAAILSGDVLFNEKDRKELAEYIQRWTAAIENHEQYSNQEEKMQTKNFEEWAIVELFGHRKISGKVSEQTVGGCAFVRVDVPEQNGHQPITKLFGNGAIYAITIVDEQTAKMMALNCNPEPMDLWSVKNLLKQLPSGNPNQDDSIDEEF